MKRPPRDLFVGALGALIYACGDVTEWWQVVMLAICVTATLFVLVNWPETT